MPSRLTTRAREARTAERNTRPLRDETGRHIGYLVELPDRAPFIVTPSGKPSEPYNTVYRAGQIFSRHLNKAHAARLRAADRLGAHDVAGTEEVAA